MNAGSEPARRRAGVLLIITAVLWLHQWLPALSVVAFLVWIFLHNRLEGDLGAHLLRGWRRVWPPASIVLVPLLVVGTVAYWMSGRPIDRKILPIGLNLLALAMIVRGAWWWPARRERVRVSAVMNHGQASVWACRDPEDSPAKG